MRTGSRSRGHTLAKVAGAERPLLHWLAANQALAAAARPLNLIVEKLASILDADCVFVAEPIEGSRATASAIACWRDGHSVEQVIYPVDSSPYGDVRSGSIATHPLTGKRGVRLGVIGAASRGRFKDEGRVRRLLAVCAPRVAGEVERLRRERHLVASRREGETLLREVHHRVKNNLQVVASLLTMQIDASTDASVRKALSDAAARIATIALIHAQLCEAPNAASVDMRAFIEELVNNVRRTFADSTTRVVIRIDVDPLDLRLHLATPIGLLVSELVTNAFQHAFVRESRGVIEVRLASRGRELILTVRDNGVGLPLAVGGAEATGMGLRLVRLLATRQLRGRLSVSTRDGTAITVRFPVFPHRVLASRRPRE